MISRFCASVPIAITVGARKVRPRVLTVSGAPARASSSSWIAFCAGVPPRPPNSVGQSIPENPAAALDASQARRRSKPSSLSCRDQYPNSRHSSGRLWASQARSSSRNCSSASAYLRSIAPPLALARGSVRRAALRLSRYRHRMTAPTEPHSVKPPVLDVDVDRLRAALHGLMPGVRADLERLVRIPSVSAAAFDQAHVQASADAVTELLRDAGFTDVQQLRAVVDGRPGAPAVVGRRPAPEGAPTVMLYAHHDVQPPGADADWITPVFEPTERNGRLYARGAADDKAGVMVHVAALRALGDDLGVGVVVFVEGEEEIGSPTFG